MQHPIFSFQLNVVALLQGWANLFIRRVIGRKPKTPASHKISL